MSQNRIFQYHDSFELESGKFLPGFQLQYTTYGSLNEAKDNVIWICHALTGSAEVHTWWTDLLGPGKVLDTEHYFIVCANMLGGCYGSTGPLSVHPSKLVPWFHAFPELSNRDIVASFDLLRQHLQIKEIYALIGGSLGGQQALEWAILKPFVFKHLALLATNAQHSPWGIAFNEAQRMAIQQDITWKLNTEKAGLRGLQVARAIGMLSYRQYETFEKTQSEESPELKHTYKASSYVQYQGEKLSKRFNAFTYMLLARAMDTHHIGRGRGSIEAVLSEVLAKTLVVGINSDILFPTQEQKLLAKHIPDASYKEISSLYGHDGFLVETLQLEHIFEEFFQKKTKKQEIYEQA